MKIQLLLHVGDFKVKDLLGREISVGDMVAVSIRSQGNNYIRVGKVLELRPYDHKCGTWHEPKVETRIGAFVEVLSGNARNYSWDYNRRTFFPAKPYRKTYRNEKNIVIVEKHWLRVRELEEAFSAAKIEDAKKRNDTTQRK